MKSFLMGLLVVLAGAEMVTAQGTLEFKFEGRVIGGTERGATVPIGTTATGWLIVDSSSTDTDLSVQSGTYPSSRNSFSIALAGRDFNLPAKTGNTISLFNNEAHTGWDMLNVNGTRIGDATALQLQFDDPTGTLLTDDMLKLSGELLNSFPTATIFVTDGAHSGSYRMTFTLTQLPEPSVTTIVLTSAAFLIASLRRIQRTSN